MVILSNYFVEKFICGGNLVVICSGYLLFLNKCYSGDLTYGYDNVHSKEQKNPNASENSF